MIIFAPRAMTIKALASNYMNFVKYIQQKFSKMSLIKSTKEPEDYSPNETNVEHQTALPEERLMSFFHDEPIKGGVYRHSSILLFTNEHMERYHNYIQWVFPTDIPSSVNSDAPLLTPNFCTQFAIDEIAKHNYCLTCRKFLNFLGLDCQKHENTNSIESLAGSDRRFYALPYHNNLRITRMLRSLRQTGHIACADQIFSYIQITLNDNPDVKVDPFSMDKWKEAMEE